MGSACENPPVARELAMVQQHETPKEQRRKWHTEQRRESVEEGLQLHSQDILHDEEQIHLQEQQELHRSSKWRVRPVIEAAPATKRGADAPQQLSASQRRQEGCLMVLKIGTSTLMTEDGGAMHMSLSNIGRFVDLVCELRARGHAVVVVSSGAVGAGCVTLHLKQRPEQVNMKQAVASVGQCRLMRLYEDLFGLREQKVAQLLVSRHDLVHQKSYQNFRSSLRALLALSVIPVINENDSVATEELRFGDNDTLAAHIAVAVEAKWLFILTDVDCLYDKNPHKHPDARPVALVDRLTDVYAFLSERECGGWGTGGMYTKVVASKIATNMGVHVAITHGQDPFRVLDMFSYVETHFERLLTPPFPPVPLQQQSRRSSMASMRSDGQASSENMEDERDKIFFCRDGLKKGRNLAARTAATTAPSPENSISAAPTVGTANSLEGSIEVPIVSPPPGDACSGINATIQRENERLAAGFPEATCREAPNAPQCGSGYDGGKQAENSCGRYKPSSGNTSQCSCDSLVDCRLSGSPRCGDQRGNAAFAARDKNTCHDLCDNSGDPRVGYQCESDCNVLFVAAFEEKAKMQTSPSEQGEGRQQKRLQAEGSSQGPWRAVAGQQRQRRLLERDQQDFQAKPSLMICKNIQQMPFLGTVFLATSLMAHKRGDTKAWILSLPVRGALFVDQGAVEALVQQKKSLFAAGVRHVAGNFTASECVAVYFDTCYDVRHPEGSSSGSAGGRSRLAGKGGSIGRLDHSRAINKHYPRACNGAVTDEGRAEASAKGAICCSGGWAELGKASTTVIRPENNQKLWGKQGSSLDAGGCRLGKTQNGGFRVSACACGGAAAESSSQKSGQESSASETHEVARPQKEREDTGKGSVGSCEKSSAHTVVPNLLAPSCSVPATSVKDASAAARAVDASIAASGDGNDLCHGSAACLDGATTTECSAMSESNSVAADDGIDECMLRGPARRLAGPPESLEIARCISNFSSAELQVIKGKKSSEFRKLLGYPVDDEVAHRQHIVFTFMNGHEVLEQLCLGLGCDK